MPVPCPKGPICTRASLVEDFRGLGLKSGELLLLHSSLSRIGWVCGGAEAVVLALLDVLGPEGTLVVPSQSSDNSDPRQWQNPPVPEDWWPVIRENTPAYNPQTTRTRAMGAIVEALRTWPGALRSAHPQTSFTAIGPRAAAILADHLPSCRVGEQSPLAKLEAAKARVLLLGVGFDCCTSFHLAEYRLPHLKHTQNSFALQTAEGRQWMTVEDVDINGDCFEKLGGEFIQEYKLAAGTVGAAQTWLFPLADAVAFAQQKLPEYQ